MATAQVRTAGEAETAVVAMLHRRRQVSGSRTQLPQTKLEVGLLDHYERPLTPQDVGGGLALRVTDLSGRSVTVVNSSWPLNVFSQALGFDVYVFGRAWSNEGMELFGWLPGPQVEQAPVEWFVRDGVRTNYAHRIDNEDHLASLPKTFDFVACPHFDIYGGIWSVLREAWECFGCGQYVYSESSRERIANEVGLP